MWTESTTSPPVRLSAQTCWQSRIPSFQELWLATSRIPKKGKFTPSKSRIFMLRGRDIRVFERGQAGGEPATVYCQLAEPDSTNPTYIIGVQPISLVRENPFRPPGEFFDIETPYMEQRVTFNITPKYSFVDLHIGEIWPLNRSGRSKMTDKLDYGMDGLSAPMHKCQKIWFMYPPTEKNLSLMAKEDGQVVKMTRLAQSLEGGVMFYTSSDSAVYIPSGCIHGPLTVSGGFLVTMDFTTRNSVLPFSRYLNLNLYASLDQEGQRDCYYLYLECLSVALANGRHNLAIKCWISVGDRLNQRASTDHKWKAAASACWGSFLSTRIPHGTICPCNIGCHEIEFAEHFRDSHLWFLNRDARPRSTRRTQRHSTYET